MAATTPQPPTGHNQDTANRTLAVVRNRYPNALSTAETVDRLLDLMRTRLGVTPGRIVLGDSICSDDLNAIEYPPRAYEMLGPFKLGGLDGFPFAGLTGRGAFAHHVPADGAVFLFHGPHIGISKAGETGVLLRPGLASLRLLRRGEYRDRQAHRRQRRGG